MMDPEHLAALRRGVDAWSKWRAKNPKIIVPLLSHVDLSGMNLRRADLSRADLRQANLKGAHLEQANLQGADLTGANLIEANLTDACSREAHLVWADLRGANLGGADISQADLSDADLLGAELGKVNARETYLNRANLIQAKLIEAELVGADLRGANLSGADLSGAMLEHVDARFCQLCRCVLKKARLTGTKLYAAAKDDWVIDGIDCRYVFLSIDGEIRSPQDRDFAPGEFEQIYRTLPTIEYVFQQGMTPMDPLIMDRVVQAIQEQNPEFDIRIDSIGARGLVPSIKFTVQKEEHKELALAEVTKVYEAKVHELAGRLDEARAFIQLLIDRPNSVYIENPTGPLAIGGSTINIDQHVEYITNLRDGVAALPEDSPTFAKVAKKTALDIVGSALKDVAKGQVKKAAEQIIELGKDLGPVIVNTAAYAFFRSYLGL